MSLEEACVCPTLPSHVIQGRRLVRIGKAKLETKLGLLFEEKNEHEKDNTLLLCQRHKPEVMIGQLLDHRYGHPLSYHQQEGDHYIMVALVVVQLGVPPQNVQDDVDQLLLQHLPLISPHP